MPESPRTVSGALSVMFNFARRDPVARIGLDGAENGVTLDGDHVRIALVDRAIEPSKRVVDVAEAQRDERERRRHHVAAGETRAQFIAKRPRHVVMSRGAAGEAEPPDEPWRPAGELGRPLEMHH